MPLEEQGLLTLAEHMNSIPVFSEVRVSQSLVFCEGEEHCWPFCPFNFGHYVVCFACGSY